MKSPFLILTVVFFSLLSYAQIDTSEQNISESKVILEDIQKENYFRKGSINARMGLVQLSSNKASSALQLNSSDQLPFIEIAGDTRIIKNWGIALTFQHAQNAMNSGTTNATSAYQRVYQLGPIYKYIMDQNNIKNYISFKVQYYMMQNNFKLSNPQLMYAKQESGYLLGIERSIPATELIDLQGGFDMVFINKFKSESILEVKNTGNGLQFHIDMLYALQKNQRVGLSYAISAFFNKYTQPDFEGRDHHTQTCKALSFMYSYLF